MVGTLYRVFSSVRFFLVILALLLVLIAVASVVPQNPDSGGAVVRAVGLNQFYTSSLFFLLGALLEINLLLCTVPRLIKRLQRGRTPGLAYGPDVIHVGLAILILAGVFSLALRREQVFLVPTGETVAFEGRQFTVMASAELTGDDGTVTGWTIRLTHGDDDYELGQNNPVSVDGYRLHFIHWGREPYAELKLGETRTVQLHEGEALQSATGELLVLDRIDGAAAHFRRLAPDGREQETVTLRPGESYGGVRYAATGREVLNGFKVSRDPTRPFMLTGLLLVAAGMVMYILSRRRTNG